jgi:hypothetical protein
MHLPLGMQIFVLRKIGGKLVQEYKLTEEKKGI